MISSNNGERADRRPGRVVLLGGKALAIRCLERMLDMPNIEVSAVIPCADDDPDATRWYPSLVRWARDRGVRVYQPSSVNEEGFLSVLQDLRPDVLLSVFYDKILKPPVLEQARLAAVNIHFGLLPYNRGSFPIPWAIIDGNEPGVTMHHMDDRGVDTEDIIAQLAVPVSEHETALDVYERCTAAGDYLFQRHLPLLLQRRAPRRPQPASGGTYYRPGYPFDRWIDWSQDAATIARFVRALSFPPFPSARTAFGGQELELRHPVWTSPDERRWQEGTVVDIDPNDATIATGNGLLVARTMKFAGEELPASEALHRVGSGEGSVLESVRWQRSIAA